MCRVADLGCWVDGMDYTSSRILSHELQLTFQGQLWSVDSGFLMFVLHMKV